MREGSLIGVQNSYVRGGYAGHIRKVTSNPRPEVVEIEFSIISYNEVGRVAEWQSNQIFSKPS